MPFKSEKQRKYLWENNPKIARRWADEEKTRRKAAKMLGKRKARES